MRAFPLGVTALLLTAAGLAAGASSSNAVSISLDACGSGPTILRGVSSGIIQHEAEREDLVPSLPFLFTQLVVELKAPGGIKSLTISDGESRLADWVHTVQDCE